MTIKPVRLGREEIANGQIESYLLEAERLGIMRRVTPEERAISRAAALSRYPRTADGVWVFSYGSLMWNPTFEFDRRDAGTVHGYHRRFCLRTALGRGTPACPGYVLGLDRGGSCHGVAFRIPAEKVDNELKLIWDREMVGHAYMARTLKVRLGSKTVPAIGFVMDRTSDNYVGRLPDTEVATAIAGAEGPLGPCREYLFETADHLAEIGLVDRYVDHMAALVRATMKD
jgi:cation transport protein ChaC